jgi:excisionase family DNA binding protein
MTQHDTDRTSGRTRQDDDMTASMRVTVEEAAKILDVTVDAVRKRIERGTLRSEKVGKTRYVLVDDVMTQHDTDRTRQDPDQDADRTIHDSDMAALLASMQDQIDTLKQELEDRKEEGRRKDAILMTMAQRIPELEAPSEPREAPVSPSDSDGKEEAPPEQEKRSWWRAFFGLE